MIVRGLLEDYVLIVVQRMTTGAIAIVVTGGAEEPGGAANRHGPGGGLLLLQILQHLTRHRGSGFQQVSRSLDYLPFRATLQGDFTAHSTDDFLFSYFVFMAPYPGIIFNTSSNSFDFHLRSNHPPVLSKEPCRSTEMLRRDSSVGRFDRLNICRTWFPKSSFLVWDGCYTGYLVGM